MPLRVCVCICVALSVSLRLSVSMCVRVLACFPCRENGASRPPPFRLLALPTVTVENVDAFRKTFYEMVNDALGVYHMPKPRMRMVEKRPFKMGRLPYWMIFHHLMLPATSFNTLLMDQILLESDLGAEGAVAAKRAKAEEERKKAEEAEAKEAEAKKKREAERKRRAELAKQEMLGESVAAAVDFEFVSTGLVGKRILAEVLPPIMLEDESGKKFVPEKSVTWDEFMIIAATLLHMNKVEMLRRA